MNRSTPRQTRTRRLLPLLLVALLSVTLLSVVLLTPAASAATPTPAIPALLRDLATWGAPGAQAVPPLPTPTHGAPTVDAAAGVMVIVTALLSCCGCVVGVGAFAFWVWMIVDCATRQFKDSNEKIIWVLVVVLLNWLGALIYFIAGRPRGSHIPPHTPGAPPPGDTPPTNPPF